MSDQEAVKARVEVLAKVFTGRLHVRFEKMNATYAQCVASGDAVHWSELHRQLHALADAAGSFGFDELGVQASRIAARLAQGELHAHDIHDIGQALAALQSAAPNAS